LVDCGISDPSASDGGWGVLCSALKACEVEPHRIRRLIVTHPHADHYGMAARLVEESGCELVMHEAVSRELDAYRDPRTRTERTRALLSAHGVSRDVLDEVAGFEDWRPYVSGVLEASRAVRDEDVLAIGGRRWLVVHTPGHSRAHVCLFSVADAIAVSGDHLLPAITPHIDLPAGDDDPLGDYLASLEKIEKLAPKLVLPGHGRPFEGGAERARVTLRHHERRLGAILQVVRHQARSAGEISDEIFGTQLLDFERRLAIGEALAHLIYLERRGEIAAARRDDGVVAYRKVARAGDAGEA
jgi:glyoxylase-like metal-dependent hydrolase (beta-lactamase superfamily II)